MKTENKKDGNKKTEKPGTGERAKVGISLIANWTIDGEVHHSNFNIEGIATIEQVKYAVQEIFSTIGDVATKVAAGMAADGQGAPSARASESVTA